LEQSKTPDHKNEPGFDIWGFWLKTALNAKPSPGQMSVSKSAPLRHANKACRKKGSLRSLHHGTIA